MRHPVRWIASLALLAALVALSADPDRQPAIPISGVAPDVDRAAGPDRRTALDRRRPTTTTRSAPAPKIAKKTRTRSTATRTPVGAPSITTTARSRRAVAVSVSACTSTPPRTWPREQIELQTPTPGFAAQIYVANRIELSLPYGDSAPLTARGWRGPVGADANVRGDRPHPALALERRALSLLPRLDREAAARPAAPRRSPSSPCSAERAPLRGRSSASLQRRSSNSG